ncbi:MAG: BLUF domain-containing protein [Gammaproteobacteria bacterium]|nr:BLUF domain-containing protein [Gammaproteobacteria bacterium]
MYLVRLIYASTINQGFDQKDIEQILTVSRKNNASNHISGILCFGHNYFLQCLEGGRSAVNQVYHKILQDERHNNPLIVDYSEIDLREFSDWTMGYVPENLLGKALQSKYSPSTEFNPYNMTGESCHLMMRELKQQIPTL